MFSGDQVKKIIQDIVAPDDFDKLLKKAREKNINIIDYLVGKKIISTSIFYKKAAELNGLLFIDLKNQIIRGDILILIPEPIASTHKIIAFDEEKEKIKIATLDPHNLEIFEFIKNKINKKIEVYLTTPENITIALKQYHKSLRAEFDNLVQTKTDKIRLNLRGIPEDLSVVKIVNTILKYGIFERASDIHIEPEEKSLIVRYRVDGILRNVMTLPKNVQTDVIARIKILSNLKIDEHHLPQEGRIKIYSHNRSVSFCVSIIPTYDGEKIVMRILNEKAQALILGQIGLQKSSMETLKKNIFKPHGMILVTGPTGSGKSTTLYTALNVLNTPKVNISTIEDPIEIRIQHINQSQVNQKIGFTFAIGLRAILRQDPNIIMIGEICDQETAKLSFHAAMTGQLILSTMNTKDAVSTILRLKEMGVATFLIASTINVIVTQRLVRKICPNCIHGYYLNKKAVVELREQYDDNIIIKTLEKEKIITDANKTIETLLFYQGKGCKQCNNTGYKGQIGIYETLEVTPAMAKLIIGKASSAKIKKQAQNQGMLSMVEDGFIKAKNGITTIEEILRITKD